MQYYKVMLVALLLVALACRGQARAVLPEDVKGVRTLDEGRDDPFFNHDPQYDFAYRIHDEETGDAKDQTEQRRGDTVEGTYSVVDPTGTLRVVKYTASDAHGFQAVVSLTPGHSKPIVPRLAAPAAERRSSVVQQHVDVPVPVQHHVLHSSSPQIVGNRRVLVQHPMHQTGSVIQQHLVQPHLTLGLQQDVQHVIPQASYQLQQLHQIPGVHHQTGVPLSTVHVQESDTTKSSETATPLLQQIQNLINQQKLQHDLLNQQRLKQGLSPLTQEQLQQALLSQQQLQQDQSLLNQQQQLLQQDPTALNQQQLQQAQSDLAQQRLQQDQIVLNQQQLQPGQSLFINHQQLSLLNQQQSQQDLLNQPQQLQQGQSLLINQQLLQGQNILNQQQLQLDPNLLSQKGLLMGQQQQQQQQHQQQQQQQQDMLNQQPLQEQVTKLRPQQQDTTAGLLLQENQQLQSSTLQDGQQDRRVQQQGATEINTLPQVISVRHSVESLPTPPLQLQQLRSVDSDMPVVPVAQRTTALYRTGPFAGGVQGTNFVTFTSPYAHYIIN